mgnify:CR=1 FL=1
MRNPAMPRRPAWQYLFILIPWVFGFGMEVRNAAHAFAVAGREASVEGRFVGGPSHDHGQYDYRFDVAGRGGPMRAWTTTWKRHLRPGRP